MPQPNRAYVSSSPPVYSAPRKSAGTIILSVFLVLTIIGAGVLGFLYLDSNNKIDDLNQQVTENNSSIGTLNQTIVSKDATITSLNQTNSSLSSQNNTLTSQNTSLTTQLGTFQSKYPAKPFYSGNAAVTWFNNNAIFYRGNDLQYATDVQQKAADAGFIVNITFGDTLTFVTAICSNGDLVGAFNGGYIYLN